MRMVFALLLVAYCFAFSLPLRQYVRVLVLVISPICAVICNIIRTVCAVWVYAHYHASADLFHAVSGWVMLLVAFGLLLSIVRLMRWTLVPVTRFTLAND